MWRFAEKISGSSGSDKIQMSVSDGESRRKPSGSGTFPGKSTETVPGGWIFSEIQS